MVIIGAIIGWVMYARRDVPIEAPTGNALTRAARQDLYGDAVNDVLVVQPTYRAAEMITTFDNKAVDGGVAVGVGFSGCQCKDGGGGVGVEGRGGRGPVHGTAGGGEWPARPGGWILIERQT